MKAHCAFIDYSDTTVSTLFYTPFWGVFLKKVIISEKKENHFKVINRGTQHPTDQFHP